MRTLSRVHGCPAVDLRSKAIDLDTLALVPAELCWKHPCLPLFVSRGGSRDVLYLGLDRRYDHLEHHDFVFSADPETEFHQIYEEGRPAEDPTCYVCAPAKTDPAVAPEGGEAL